MSITTRDLKQLRKLDYQVTNTKLRQELQNTVDQQKVDQLKADSDKPATTYPKVEKAQLQVQANKGAEEKAKGR